MTQLDVHIENKKSVERALHFLEFTHGPGVPVVRHALESILKRCMMVEEFYEDKGERCWNISPS